VANKSLKIIYVIITLPKAETTVTLHSEVGVQKIKFSLYMLLGILLSACSSVNQPDIPPTLEGQAGVTGAKEFNIVFSQSMNSQATEPAISIFRGVYNTANNPASFTPLTLTVTCNGQWLVKNSNTTAISFSWEISGATEKGVGVVGANGQSIFYTSTGTKILSLLVGTQLQKSLANSTVTCTTAKPFMTSWSSDSKILTLKYTQALASNTNFTVVVSTVAKTSANANLITEPLRLGITTKNTLLDKEIPFSGTEAQAAWTLITSNANLRLYSLSLNTSEAGAYKIATDEFTFVVPESTGTSLIFAGVRAGKVTAIWRYNFDFPGDKLSVSNILDARSVTVDNMSKLRPVGTKILSLANPTSTVSLADQLKPLAQNPAFVNPACATSNTQSPCKTALETYNARVNTYADRLSFATYNLISVFGLAPTNIFYPRPTTPRDWVSLGATVVAPLYPIQRPAWVWKTGLAGIIVNTAILGETIQKAGSALDAYNAVFNCAKANDPNYKSGTGYIALTSPPLPFSYQVFVQSLPDKVNIATGYLRPGYTDQNVKDLLDSAVPNAEATWELLTDTIIVPNSTQTDIKLKAISTSYTSRQCIP
jgi:hypothetical protein